MGAAARFLHRNRFPLAALAISAGVHAAVLMGMPERIAAIEKRSAAAYLASLDEAVLAPPRAEAVAANAGTRPPPPRRAPVKRKPVVPPPEAVAAAAEAAPAPAPPPPEPAAELSRELLAESEPEVVAMAAAESAAPLPAVAPDPFPVQALPPSLSISYQLTSAFADGRAVYTWEREGDSYRITGEAQAEGFFTLFLEGRILQEARGTVTEAGLKPERFVERKPNNVREGLEFDWEGRRVTFSSRGRTATSELADNTVDWLSMIFQLAHVPPRNESSLAIQVFTQRRMYRYRLEVVGIEDIDIPLGRVRALHLRHDDPNDGREAVDVWLGVDQHYLPVKLRFPVARNRLMVEQVATRVSTR